MWPTSWPSESSTVSISPGARPFAPGSSPAMPLISWTPIRAAADALLADATELFKRIDKFAIVACIHNRLQIAWRTGELPHADSMAADLDDLPDRPFVRRQRLLLDIHAAACAGEWEPVIAASLEHYGLDEETSMDMLHFRAEALGALGRLDEAIATLDQIDTLDPFEDLARTNSQILRATTELRRGDTATALSLLAESAASFSRESDRVQRTYLASLAGAAAHQLGEDETAARLFGHGRAICGRVRRQPADVRAPARRAGIRAMPSARSAPTASTNSQTWARRPTGQNSSSYCCLPEPGRSFDPTIVGCIFTARRSVGTRPRSATIDREFPPNRAMRRARSCSPSWDFTSRAYNVPGTADISFDSMMSSRAATWTTTAPIC